ncbi:YhgE/Pip domain-containing protein [Paenibacillus lemnae]|uniref:YhgE/Pip domain-containing protein n=1 Tax=Paenibacillus lemnae TaxID=1330551 RepID=A0A848M767_PAELE|nr:YhgE/Pip domain-containing protein [Paenibacillus lemnae]NMO95693.1 YhgE/Pip domain-containing protein [Paenibacillus lemnae]
MKSLSVFFKDMGAAARNRKLLIPLIAVLFIPLMYSGMFLGAFWDPYGKMNDLPVAVVNNDQGAVFEGKTLTAGEDLVKELKKGADFNWQFVSRQEAEEGMKDNKYYMTIIIPDNFSKQATTVLDDQPAPAQLLFEPNEGYNFLAGQIGGSAVKEIQSKVSAKVTEAYTETLFGQVKTIADGLSDAGSGATQISDGAQKLDAGALKLKQNLTKLVSGTEELRSGIAPLTKGVVELNTGAGTLHQGADKLSSGLYQLLQGHEQLQAGAVQTGTGSRKLQAGLEAAFNGSKELTAGLKASQSGAAALQSGAQSAESGAGKLEAGLSQSLEGTASLEQGAQSVAAGLKQLAASNEELASMPEVQKLLAASEAVAAGSSKLNEGQKQLAAGAAELKQGTARLGEGAGQLSAGAGQLVQGSEKLHAGNGQLLAGAKELTAGQDKLSAGMKQFGSKLSEAAGGGKELAAGAARLNEGTRQLSAGAGKLGSGVSTLADGSKQLDAGAGELVSGMDTLKTGTGELAGKLNEAANKTGSVKATDTNYAMFAQPVQVDEHKVNEVPNYGTGFAPYFLSLGLFVGALITSIVMPVYASSVPGASGFSRFVSRTLSFAGMGILQALLAVVVLLYGLKLEVQSVPMFYMFSILTSLSYMFLIQALVTWLDLPGRFVAIVILILQLTTSAGTFPLELIPNWMKAFNPLLPMTYSVSGFKAVISTGDMGYLWSNAGVLAAFGGAFLIITALYFLTHRYKNKIQDTAAAPAV